MTRPNNRELNPPLTQSAEARMDAALRAEPQVRIPQDFAINVAALAAAQDSRPRRHVPQIGRSTALLLMPLLAAALFALAPHASPNVKSILFDTQMMLLVELAAIGWWVTRVPSLRIPRWR